MPISKETAIHGPNSVEKRIKNLEAISILAPSHDLAHMFLAIAYEQAGMLREALKTRLIIEDKIRPGHASNALAIKNLSSLLPKEIVYTLREDVKRLVSEKVSTKNTSRIRIIKSAEPSVEWIESYDELDFKNLDQYGIPLLLKCSGEAKKSNDLEAAQDILIVAVRKLKEKHGSILDDPNPAMALADLYFKLGQEEEAQKIWDEFEEDPVRGVSGLSARSCVRHSIEAQKKGEWDDVVVFQERLREIKPKSTAAIAILAKAYFYTGAYKKACKLYEILEEKNDLSRVDQDFWSKAKENL